MTVKLGYYLTKEGVLLNSAFFLGNIVGFSSGYV